MVEIQLRSLENVTISAAGLTRARGDDSQETTSTELGGELGVNGEVLLASSNLLLDRAGELDVLTLGVLQFSGLSERGTLNSLLGELEVVVLLEIVTEGSSINEDNGVLHESLGTNQLVVGGVVDDIQNTGLVGGDLRTPGEVTSFETESTELVVSTTATDQVNALGTELGVSRRTTGLVLALLLVGVTTTTSGASLVTGIASNRCKK